MGATNDIKGSNITLKLVDLVCPECEEKFSEKDIANNNFDLWFDTSNDVQLIPIKEIKEGFYYFPFSRRTGYQLTIWIRSIEHKDCPQINKANHDE